MITKESIEKLLRDLGSEVKEHTTAEIERAVGEAEKRGADATTALKDEVEKRLTAIETRDAERPVGGVDMPGLEDEKEEFRFSRALLAIAHKRDDIAPFEMSVLNEARQKALSQGTDSAGGYVVPNQYIAELIELLRSKLVLRAMGATVMDGLMGSPVEIPKHTGGATGAWIAEGSAITPSDQTFGQLSLTPNQASGATVMSNRLNMLSNPAAETIVRNDLVAVIARLVDLAGLRGSGSSNQPTGIASTAGIGSVVMGAPDGGAVTYDKLQEFVTTLDEADALEGNVGWVFSPAVRGRINVLKDGDSRPLFVDTYNRLPGVRDGALISGLLNYPWATTTQIPTNLTKGSGTNLSEIYFGNWSELIIGIWGGLQIASSMEAGDVFLKNQMMVRVIQETDIGVRHPASFVYANDVATG